MVRQDAIDKLRAFEPRFRALGVTSLFLFGSTARDEATETSDLDLFLDVESGCRFSILDLASVQRLLIEELGADVDLTTRDALHPMMRDEILVDAKQVF